MNMISSVPASNDYFDDESLHKKLCVLLCMPQNAPECIRMHQNASECTRMHLRTPEIILKFS